MTVPEFHESVLAEPVAAALAPAIDAGPDSVLVDATCGAGGHTAAVLGRCRPTRAVLFDRDPAALAFARERLGGLQEQQAQDERCTLNFCHAPFSSLRETLDGLGVTEVAALIADLGVSSHQFDAGERGFSFRVDAPLDMRMDPTQGQTAAEVLATIDEAGLTEALRRYGEEPEARRIAAAIVRARPRTTGALATVVEEAMSGRARRLLGKRIHPATRTFQALRILVNGELEELEVLLRDGPERLRIGGRMAVISFHSLEDRRVKQRFAALSRPPHVPHDLPLTRDELPQARFVLAPELPRRGVQADEAELARNPRSRSARLRVLERRA